jgi:hypothetical protein
MDNIPILHEKMFQDNHHKNSLASILNDGLWPRHARHTASKSKLVIGKHLRQSSDENELAYKHFMALAG